MRKKDIWESWKKHDNHIERNIFRGLAEDEQIRLETIQKGIIKGHQKIFVRDQFVALKPEGVTAKLRLGDHRHMVVVKINDDSLVTFIPDLSEEASC